MNDDIEQLKQSRQDAWNAVIKRDEEINITIKNLREELSRKTFEWELSWKNSWYNFSVE